MAKNLLWSNCSWLSDNPGGRDSTMRAQSSADIIDILQAFRRIEENNVTLPIHVAVKLDCIP